MRPLVLSLVVLTRSDAGEPAVIIDIHTCRLRKAQVSLMEEYMYLTSDGLADL